MKCFRHIQYLQMFPRDKSPRRRTSHGPLGLITKLKSAYRYDPFISTVNE